jgi:hypothetical protein
VNSVRVFLLSAKQRNASPIWPRKSPEKKGSHGVHGVHGGFSAVDISIVLPGHTGTATALSAGMSKLHRRDAYDTFASATGVTPKPSEKYHRRPACAAVDGWKSANGSAGKIGLSSSIVALGGNPEHRRDAYDTFGSATGVTPKPSEKYHRRPACAAQWRLEIGKRLRRQDRPFKL